MGIKLFMIFTMVVQRRLCQLTKLYSNFTEAKQSSTALEVTFHQISFFRRLCRFWLDCHTRSIAIIEDPCRLERSYKTNLSWYE